MNLIELPKDFMRGRKPTISPTDGCFIAGGAIRQWFTGNEKATDIDVFGKDAKSLDGFCSSLSGFDEIAKHQHATTFRNKDAIVQRIEFFRPDMPTLLGGFDFNVCQFAWDGSKIFATMEAIVGVLRGHLAVNKLQPGFEMDSFRRAFKYQRRGFLPCSGTMLTLATALQSLTPEKIKEQVEMSPGGGKRFIHFD